MTVEEKVLEAKSNLDDFISSEPTYPVPAYPQMHYGLDWVDPTVIILVLFGGISLGIAITKCLTIYGRI